MRELSAGRLVPHDTADTEAFRVEADDRTTYDGDVFYTPVIFADGRVGYSVRNHDGQEEFIYLSPGVREDASQEPHVYVYTGTSGDPNEDTPHQFYSVADFDEPPGAGADPFGRPDPSTHPEFWRE